MRDLRMPPGLVVIAWRDQKLTSRYKATGSKRSAFIPSPGKLAIDAPAYFGDRVAALARLSSPTQNYRLLKAQQDAVRLNQ